MASIFNCRVLLNSGVLALLVSIFKCEKMFRSIHYFFLTLYAFISFYLPKIVNIFLSEK